MTYNDSASIKIMSVTESFKNIYKGPFQEYLRTSEKIGGAVYEQSKRVDVLFLLETNLIDVAQKYRKPIRDQDEIVFFEPIDIEIESIRKLRIQHGISQFADHLSLISESVTIFEWIKRTNIEETVSQFNKNIAPFINNIRAELLKLDMIHADWLYAWNCFLEDMGRFLVSFYKNGLTWDGTEKLPDQTLLGDVSAASDNTQHIKLIKEINQGQNVMRTRRSTEQPTSIDRDIASGTNNQPREESP